MDENIVEELFTKISQLEEELAGKERKIQELEAELARKNEVKPRKSLWSVLSTAAKVRTFESNAIKFCHSVQGDNSKIEFPVDISKPDEETASLSRALSTNSLITQELGIIKDLSRKRLEIENEINRKREEILEAAKKTADIMESYYHEPLSSLTSQVKSILTTIKSEIDLSLITENTTQRVFLVDNLDIDTSQLTLTQLKDSYGIALLSPPQSTKPINDLENFRVIIKSETQAIMDSLDSQKMVVYYQLIEVENNEKICCPVNITPNKISLKDYEIKFNNSQQKIVEIVNKPDGPIKFGTVVVSEDCGLIQASVIQIFTFEISSHIFNIIHLHVDDMKEEIPVEAVYILDSQSANEYEDWEKDAFGRDLRYKLLVKSGKIEAVLYNTGTTTEYIQFLERKIKIGDQFAYEDMVVEIISIPTGMVARDWQGRKIDFPMEFSMKPPHSYCNARHVSDLPGLVDVKIIMKDGAIIKQGDEIAVPICQCVELSIAEKNQILNTICEGEKENMQKIVRKAAELEELIMKYNTMAVKGNQEFLDEITRLIVEVKECFGNNQEMFYKYQSVVSQAERVVRSVAIDIRFST